MKHILLTLLLVMTFNVNANDFDKGTNAYEKGNYQEAFKWFKKSAKQGNANAQFNVGLMYQDGRGVLKDEKEAFKWFKKSAEQGLAEAQNYLARMYPNEQGSLKNKKEAFKRVKKPAEQLKTYKDWTWTTKSNTQGEFVATTNATNIKISVLAIVAKPTKEQCEISYSFAIDPPKISSNISANKDIIIQLQVNAGDIWQATGKSTAMFNPADGTAIGVRIDIRAHNILKSLRQIIEGDSLHFVVVGEEDTVYTYSLAGSAAAVKAIMNQCPGRRTVSPSKRIKPTNTRKERTFEEAEAQRRRAEAFFSLSTIPGIARGFGGAAGRANAGAMERRRERRREERNRQSRHDDYMRELRNLNNKEIRCSTSYGRSTGGNNWADTTCR